MEMIKDISLENTFKISDRISLAEVEAHFQGAMIQSKCFSTIFAIMCKASDMQGLQIVVDSHSSFRCMQGHIEWLAWQHHSVASMWIILCPASAQGELQGKPCHIYFRRCLQPSQVRSVWFAACISSLWKVHQYSVHSVFRLWNFDHTPHAQTQNLLQFNWNVHLTTISVLMWTEP